MIYVFFVFIIFVTLMAVLFLAWIWWEEDYYRKEQEKAYFERLEKFKKEKEDITDL